MTPEERTLITGLFDRLRSVNPGQKDQEAEQLIQQSTASQPNSPYLLVQTLLVQEHALNNAQVRIQELEKQVAQPAPSGSQGSGGGFLSGLFGHHSDPAPAQPAAQQQPPAIPTQRLPQNPAYVQSAPPYPSTVGMAPSAGGGFLKSALTTAAGVAGGAALFSGIESLLGHHAGPFGPAMGGGFFGGGGGYGGGPEVVNNYYDERGGGDRPESGSFLGGTDSGVQQTGAVDNRSDSGNFNDSGFDTSNPFSGPSQDFQRDDVPPTDDPSANSIDNTFDTDNTDAGGGDFSSDAGGGDFTSNDDGSLV